MSQVGVLFTELRLVGVLFTELRLAVVYSQLGVFFLELTELSVMTPPT